MNQVIIINIGRFDTVIKECRLCLHIDENTDEATIRAAFSDYLTKHKDKIVNVSKLEPKSEHTDLFLSARERQFKEIMGHVNHGLPLEYMTKYWRIVDGFDKKKDHVNSYIHMDIQPLVKI